jgi:hypothetical protein
MSAFTGTDERTNAATKYKTIKIMKTPSALEVALMILLISIYCNLLPI